MSEFKDNTILNEQRTFMNDENHTSNPRNYTSEMTDKNDFKICKS